MTKYQATYIIGLLALIHAAQYEFMLGFVFFYASGIALLIYGAWSHYMARN